MKPKYTEAYELLEAMQPGYYRELIETCLEYGGVVHMSKDCFLCGIPCGDNAECLYIIFQCSQLPALRKVLCSLPYKKVRWGRGLAGRKNYGIREREIKDFCKHEWFGLEKKYKG